MTGSVRVLFLCLGNICRSPLAEGLFGRCVADAGVMDRVAIASAGLGSWHRGNPPHEGSIRAAAALGCDITSQRSATLEDHRPEAFDLVLAMDRAVLDRLRASLPSGADEETGGRARAELFLDYAGKGRIDVPDPYGFGQDAYEAVAMTILDACPAILERLRREYGV